MIIWLTESGNRLRPFTTNIGSAVPIWKSQSDGFAYLAISQLQHVTSTHASKLSSTTPNTCTYYEYVHAVHFWKSARNEFGSAFLSSVLSSENVGKTGRKKGLRLWGHSNKGRNWRGFIANELHSLSAWSDLPDGYGIEASCKKCTCSLEHGGAQNGVKHTQRMFWGVANR